MTAKSVGRSCTDIAAAGNRLVDEGKVGNRSQVYTARLLTELRRVITIEFGRILLYSECIICITIMRCFPMRIWFIATNSVQLLLFLDRNLFSSSSMMKLATIS